MQCGLLGEKLSHSYSPQIHGYLGKYSYSLFEVLPNDLDLFFQKSAFDGIVSETGYTDIAGNYIKIQSENEIQTFYGHTQFIFVKQGDKILQGQIIATVGDTGLVTGPHLHFEVLYNGYRINPEFMVE